MRRSVPAASSTVTAEQPHFRPNRAAGPGASGDPPLRSLEQPSPHRNFLLAPCANRELAAVLHHQVVVVEEAARRHVAIRDYDRVPRDEPTLSLRGHHHPVAVQPEQFRRRLAGFQVAGLVGVGRREGDLASRGDEFRRVAVEHVELFVLARPPDRPRQDSSSSEIPPARRVARERHDKPPLKSCRTNLAIFPPSRPVSPHKKSVWQGARSGFFHSLQDLLLQGRLLHCGALRIMGLLDSQTTHGSPAPRSAHGPREDATGGSAIRAVLPSYQNNPAL